ncbi:zinc-finger domain-containing protein [Albimonas pacifica]|uniref:Uncharacterized conserved protein, contains Zn-finger domain n=1 Tax=Albimonas pacifica TaxID=1114924 RepID=A0A1I3KNX1_9RHOB|nr:zinc-finger domain-containing protein [Albimonas pacifica]SFI74189.1 Uncharacterized conserved protein, contains Zn-finger domain [Albimonas pacifica]
MSIDAPETEIVEKTRIACDGGGPGMGHPRVWLQIPPEDGFVECGYCDKRFILKDGPADTGTADTGAAS